LAYAKYFVACDELVETVSGWLYVPTGNLFQREQVAGTQTRSRAMPSTS
jgi:hypothetical protein